ncbi:MAG: DUF1801 domain-containing protein [Pseudomonadota bacterium]
MLFSDDDRVNAFFEDLQILSPEKLELVVLIRAVFHGTSDELSEGIKYGGLVFYRRNKLIAGIFPYTQHISIEFSNGVCFADPDGLLEGKGKMRRHLKIIDKQDIESKKVAAFAAAAILS